MADENNQQRLKVMQDIRSAHAEILRLTELEGKATQNQIDKYDVLDKALNNSRKEFVELNKQSKKLKLNLKKVGDAVAEDIQGPFNKLKGTLESLPLGNILSKVGKWDTKQKALGKSLEKTFKSGDIGVKNLAKGFGQVTKASGKMLGTLAGPVGMVALIGALVISAWNFNKAAGESAKTLGIGISQMKSLNIQSTALGLTHAEALKSIEALSTEMNGMLVTNEDLVKHSADLSFYYGISEETFAKLNTTAMSYGKTVEDVETTVGASVQQFQALGVKGLSFQNVMKEVSEVSAETRVNFKGGLAELTTSVIQAKLMGTTLDKIAQQSRQTLDVESSIAKEMEARVLLGKNISLDALRFATLSGDGAKQQQEQLKIMEQMGDFSQMDVITREKSAELLGMSVTDALKMQEHQKMMVKLGMQGKELAELDFDVMTKKLDNMNAQEREAAELFIQEQKNASMAAKWEHTTTKLMEAFGPILDITLAILTPVIDLIGLIAKGIGHLNKFADSFKDAKDGSETLLSVVIKLGGAFTAILLTMKLMKLSMRGMSGMGRGMSSMLGGGAKGFTPRSVGMPKPSVPTPAAGGGGIMSGIKSMGTKAMSSIGSSGIGKMASRGIQGAQGLASSAVGAVKGMNPLKTLQKGLKGGGSKVLKGILKKIPFGSALFEMLFAGFDIASVMGDPNLAKGDKEQQIGSTVASSLGGVLGGAGLATLAQALNVLPGLGALVAPLAYMGGDFLGRKVGGYIAEEMGAKPIGKTVMSVFGGDETALADGGMITKEINNATIGEAGPEAVVPLDKFYEKLDELKTAINHLGRRPILVKIGNNQSQQILSDGGYLNSIGNGIGI